MSTRTVTTCDNCHNEIFVWPDHPQAQPHLALRLQDMTLSLGPMRENWLHFCSKYCLLTYFETWEPAASGQS